MLIAEYLVEWAKHLFNNKKIKTIEELSEEELRELAKRIDPYLYTYYRRSGVQILEVKEDYVLIIKQGKERECILASTTKEIFTELGESNLKLWIIEIIRDKDIIDFNSLVEVCVLEFFGHFKSKKVTDEITREAEKIVKDLLLEGYILEKYSPDGTWNLFSKEIILLEQNKYPQIYKEIKQARVQLYCNSCLDSLEKKDPFRFLCFWFAKKDRAKRDNEETLTVTYISKNGKRLDKRTLKVFLTADLIPDELNEGFYIVNSYSGKIYFIDDTYGRRNFQKRSWEILTLNHYREICA